MEEITIEKPIRKRIAVLNVPIDIVQPEHLDGVVLDILQQNTPKQIVLLSLWDLMRAKRNKEYNSLIHAAALVLPVSRSLIRGARFLTGETPVRYNPFAFTIQLMSVLERYRKSLYIFGGSKSSLYPAENNVRQTFPGLKIVGRYPGYYAKNMERNIITAIQKAAPSLVIVSRGIPGKERWIYRNRRQFPESMFLWSKNIIDIFAERQKRVSDELFDKGLEILPELCKNPLKIFLFFRYLWYNFLLLIYRLWKLQ